MLRGVFFVLLCLLTPLLLAQVAAQESALCEQNIQSVQAAIGTAEHPPESGWQTVTLPHYWRTTWPKHQGSVWYRITWQKECAPLALMIDSMVMAGEIYLNGQHFWQDQHLVEPLSRSWGKARYWQLPKAMLQTENSLEIRIVGDAENSAGLGLLRLGSPEKLYSAYQKHTFSTRTFALINIVISFVLGSLALGVFLLFSQQRVLAWYALVSSSWVLLSINMLSLETWPFANSFTRAKADSALYFVFVASYLIFIWQLLERPCSQRLVKMLIPLCLLHLAWISLAATWNSLVWAGHITGLLFLISNSYFLWLCVRQRDIKSLLIGLSILFILLLSMRDILVLLGYISSRIFYAHASTLVFLLTASWLIGRETVKNARRVAQFNQQLIQVVEKTQQELSAKLASEHQLALKKSLLQTRMQLTHDLHDGLGGQIVRSIMHTEHADPPLNKQQMVSILKVLRDDLRQVIDSGASDALSAPTTPQQWAAPLMHRFDNLFDELGIQLQWQLPAAWSSQPPALACLALARVLEEALTNVLKHSQAKQATVSLHFPDANHLCLIIADNGKGFDVQAVEYTGLGIGLASMKARLQRLNGQLTLRSQAGITELQVVCPL